MAPHPRTQGAVWIARHVSPATTVRQLRREHAISFLTRQRTCWATLRSSVDAEVAEQAKEYTSRASGPKEMYDAAIERATTLEVPGGIWRPWSEPGVDVRADRADGWADAGFHDHLCQRAGDCRLDRITKRRRSHVCDLCLRAAFCGVLPDRASAGSDPGGTTTVKDGTAMRPQRQEVLHHQLRCRQLLLRQPSPTREKGAKGMPIFLVDSHPGLSVGHEDKMGIRLSNTTDAVLEDPRAGREPPWWVVARLQIRW